MINGLSRVDLSSFVARRLSAAPESLPPPPVIAQRGSRPSRSVTGTGAKAEPAALRAMGRRAGGPVTGHGANGPAAGGHPA